MNKLLLRLSASVLFLGTLINSASAQSVLLGTANQGGSGYGTVFSTALGSTTFLNTTYLNGGTQAGSPKSGVVLAPNGKFYGMSYSGGGNSYGTIYEFSYLGAINTKVNFDGTTNGNYPNGTLCLANDGNLYGMTSAGGSGGYGCLFKYTPGSGTVTVLHNFNNTNGGSPMGTVIQASNNLLYGITSGGGSFGNGVIFSYNISLSQYTVLHNFNGTTEGSNSKGELLQASDGKLYGLMFTGGSSNYGGIFSYDIGTTTFTVLKSFNQTTDGTNPYGHLVEAPTGVLVGLNSAGGAPSQGTLFDYNISTTAFNIRHVFQNNATEGGQPLGSLFKASNGKLYGTTLVGTSSSVGTLFEYNPNTFAFSHLAQFSASQGGNNPMYNSLIEYTPLSASVTQNNVSCFGGTNGSATVIPSGGTTPYTYNWAPSGGTNATATGLAPGTYTCYITEAGGSQTGKVVTITQPTQLTATIGSQNDVSCNGGNNGTATAAPSGGTPGYTYSWAPIGGTGMMGTGLMAGVSTVTVTDANGCSTTALATITQPSLLSTSIGSQNNVLCFGGATGSATISAVGGTPGYTYSWAPTGGTTSTATGLAAGSYTCTIVDANGCTKTQVVTITQPSALSPSILSQTNVSCNGGNNGSATVTASGGTPSYSYAWVPIGGTNAAVTGLSAGIYTCNVTDAAGCTAPVVVTITQPTVLSASILSQTNVACFMGFTGSATATQSGGTAGYTYSWVPAGGSGATANTLAAGTYTCTVTDANSCTATTTVSITQPTSLTAGASSGNVSCFGGSNGSATVSIGGGTPSYTYTWSPSGGNAATATGLTFGSYTCNVSDANGCTITKSVTINQPPQLTVNQNTSSNATCFGYNDGQASVLTPSGGTPTYTYDWAPGTPAGDGTLSVNGLIAGSYTFTVTDANGCNGSTIFTINEPAQLVASILNEFDVLCFGDNNGSAAVSVTGGIPSYSYSWSPSGGNLASAFSLSPGTYICTVFDANACSTTQVFTINEPTALASNPGATPVSCFGNADGTATNNPTGGVAPYNYSWAPSGQNNQTATGLSGGNYTVTITDNNGCVITDVSTVIEPNALVANATETANAGCSGMANGIADVFVVGGTSPYFYSWNSGGLNSTETGLVAGSYTCSITDNNSCPATATVTITENSNTDLIGSVTFPAGPINAGYVYAFKQQSSLNGIDTIASQALIPGAIATYNFVGLQPDNYLIKVILDTVLHPTAVPTYYGDEFQWDSSLVVTHGCIQTDTADINVLELNGGTGTGFISGYVIEGNGYTGLRLYGETHPNIPFVPGGPLKGIDIKLGKNPGGGIQARVMSDSTGYYEFTDIPDGNYTIYVDIPNLPMDSTRNVTVDAGAGNTQFSQNNYYADSTNIFILDSIVAVGIYSSALEYDNNYSIYPNPAKDRIILSFNKHNSEDVVIELNNSLGQNLYSESIQNTSKGLVEHQININDLHLNAGVYFISIQNEGKKFTQRIVVVE